jgi:hypothetical protein
MQAGECIEFILAPLFLEVSESVGEIWNGYTVSRGKWVLFLWESTLIIILARKKSLHLLPALGNDHKEIKLFFFYFFFSFLIGARGTPRMARSLQAFCVTLSLEALAFAASASTCTRRERP